MRCSGHIGHAWWAGLVCSLLWLLTSLWCSWSYYPTVRVSSPLHSIQCTSFPAAAVIGLEGLSLIADNITVVLQETTLLNCTLAGYSGAGAVSILISKAAGFYPSNKYVLSTAGMPFTILFACYFS